MSALCLLPSTPPSCSGRGPSRPPGLVATPLLPPSCSSISPQLALAGGRHRLFSGVARVGREKGGKNGGAEFFREDGVVDDMDGYLNYLSLEYDSVWDTKPAWYGVSSLFLAV